MDFVTFRWQPPPGYRSQFGPETVNTLLSMLQRNYTGDVRLHCVTDDARGISSEVDVIPLWDTFAKLPSPHGVGNPSCYRRLPAYGEEAAKLFGPRFVMLDLDICIVANVNPLFDIPDDYKIWGDTAKGTPYNGSLAIMTAGARKQVLETFHPIESPKAARALGYFGSDQAWIGACLGPNEKKWTTKDGVYSYRNEITPRGGLLPENARIVIFHGSQDPWAQTVKSRHRWVRENYR